MFLAEHCKLQQFLAVLKLLGRAKRIRSVKIATPVVVFVAGVGVCACLTWCFWPFRAAKHERNDILDFQAFPIWVVPHFQLQATKNHQVQSDEHIISSSINASSIGRQDTVLKFQCDGVGTEPRNFFALWALWTDRGLEREMLPKRPCLTSYISDKCAALLVVLFLVL